MDEVIVRDEKGRITDDERHIHRRTARTTYNTDEGKKQIDLHGLRDVPVYHVC